MQSVRNGVDNIKASAIVLAGSRSVLCGALRPAPGTLLLAAAVVAMIVVGSIDSVLYIRLTHKMDGYEWFLSQIVVTLAFCAVSWPVVLYRMWSGSITREMRSFPLRVFLWIGLLDSMGNLIGTIPAPYLPGSYISVLAKIGIPFTMIASMIFLRVRYKAVHFIGAGIIGVAVMLNLVPFVIHNSVTSNHLFWGVFIMAAAIPAAGSNVYKEKGLKEGANGDIDVWYFNSAIASFQLGWGILFAWTVFVPLPEPATYITLSEFPHYLTDASSCFLGLSGPPCDYTWAVFAVFIVFNVTANVLMLYIFQRGSAVLAIISGTTKLVLINLTYHVPFIAGEALATQVSLYNVAALVLIIIGIVVYRLRKEKRPDTAKSADIELTLLENGEEDDDEMTTTVGAEDIADSDM